MFTGPFDLTKDGDNFVVADFTDKDAPTFSVGGKVVPIDMP